MPPPRGPKAKEGGVLRLMFGFFFASIAVGVIHHNASYFSHQSTGTVEQITTDTQGNTINRWSTELQATLGDAPLDAPSAIVYNEVKHFEKPLVSLTPQSPQVAPQTRPTRPTTPVMPPKTKANPTLVLKDFAADLKVVTPLYQGPHPRTTPSAPKKITRREQEFLPEYQPCCDTRPKGRRPGMPDGEKQMAEEDAWLRKHAAAYPYPTFSGVHKCFNNAESYTAGWLARSDMVLRAKFEGVDYKGTYDPASVYGYIVKWGKSTNMEAVTHTMLGPLMQKSCVGAFKTLDAFDFSIEHLSLYERRLGLMNMESNLKAETVKAIVANLAHREKDVRRISMQRHQERLAGVESAVTPTAKALANETIVLMPFYGVAVGTGHSVVSTRFAYLNLTFWSHYRVFPHIGVVVGTQADYDFVTSKACGLPWAEVVSVIDHIAMPKNMGVAAGIAAQQKFRNKAWSHFKYMYWTESDQVLVMRDAAVEPLYALVSDGLHLVAPHRLLPFPRSDDFDPALALKLKDKGGNGKELRDNDAQTLHTLVSPQDSGAPPPLEEASCCFDPGDCTRRDQWVHFSRHDKVSMIKFSDSMGVVNGEANIFLHTWRTCQYDGGRKECSRPY